MAPDTGGAEPPDTGVQGPSAPMQGAQGMEPAAGHGADPPQAMGPGEAALSPAGSWFPMVT